MSEETKTRMKPVIVLPVGAVSKRDLARLNANNFRVVEAKDPSLVRFIDPPPLDYSAQERAAIELARSLMLSQNGYSVTRRDVGLMLAEIFMRGLPPQRIEPVKK